MEFLIAPPQIAIAVLGGIMLFMAGRHVLESAEIVVPRFATWWKGFLALFTLWYVVYPFAQAFYRFTNSGRINELLAVTQIFVLFVSAFMLTAWFCERRRGKRQSIDTSIDGT